MATISTTPALLDRVRSIASTTLAIVGNLGLYIGIALLGGVASSLYMIETGTRLTTISAGPWTTWPNAFKPDADPYTRAHFARQGSLLINASVAQTFEAHSDDDGQRLHSSCEYAVEGAGLEGAWWSIAVYDDRGRLIQNPGERYSYSSDSVARAPDSSFMIALSRDARPGNWLPTGGAGRLILVLTLIDAASGGTAADGSTGRTFVPSIRKVTCR